MAHLLVNGDRASLVMFGWLGLWAVGDMLLINAREPAWVRPEPAGRSAGDVRWVVIAAVVFAVIVDRAHLARLLAVPAMTSKTAGGELLRGLSRSARSSPMRCRGPSPKATGRSTARSIRAGSRSTSSDAFARVCGLPRSPIDELAAFHVVFGKTVPDISLNAVANLGYAEGAVPAPVCPGDTLTATSEVIGLRETSNGRSGVVWVRSTGLEPARRGGAAATAAG